MLSRMGQARDRQDFGLGLKVTPAPTDWTRARPLWSEENGGTVAADLLSEGAPRRDSPQGQLLEEPIRLLIADDDPRTTRVLRESLPPFGFDIVGNARNGAEAGDKVVALRPEVVLMDLRMPDVDGIEATVLIKAQEPRTQVVILTAFLEGDAKQAAEFMGAASLLEKDAPLDVLIDTLRAAALVYRTVAPRPT
jgi:CheY-like chemotaxis protein